ncbi:MAG: FecR domain-containing protein [Polyangiaceae bacterium]
MSASRCPRCWQAEAVLNGQLSHADAASFERHVSTCAECSAERDSLERLEQVAQRLPVLQSTPLRRRALHNELLRRAHQGLVEGEEPRPRRTRLWFAVAACALLVLALGVPRLPQVQAWLNGNAEPHFELQAGVGARWHVAQPGRSFKLSLEQGQLQVHVDKLSAQQSFAIALPDGELEVRGTRFIVDVSAGRTQRVQVDEGRVALRLADQPEFSLSRGESWAPSIVGTNASSPVTTGSASNVPAPTPAPKASLTSPAPRASVNVIARAAPKAAPSPASAGKRSTANAPTEKLDSTSPASSSAQLTSERAVAEIPTKNMARDYADAMAAFSSGDFGSAEQLFRAFEQRYPNSAHGEDILFLRALGHSRRGDVAGARDLARQYLQRYPRGFRAAEATKLAQ